MNPTTSQDALAQLQGVQAQSQNPNDILASQRQQLGVQGAQDTVTGLRGAINKTTQLLKSVAPSVMGRTAGSLVTNAQAGKQIQNEQAPISQTLTDQGTQYNDASTDADKLEAQAEQSANGIYQGQQDKQSYLQNLYNSLYQGEQSAADRAFQEKQFAYQQQKDAADRAAASKSSGSGLSDALSTLLGGRATGGAQASEQQRLNGGFNFQDSGGKAISAAKYAQLTGQDVANVLRTMAQSGDTYAGQAYNALSKVKTAAARANVLKNYGSLFWGV